MQKIVIEKNEAGQRLDRFLRKYLGRAGLGHIYRLIRKDVKVDGKRKKPDYMLQEGDEVVVYLSHEEISDLRAKKSHAKAKKQFAVIYEDGEILVVSKPSGLLVHGDSREKKNTLANQVLTYLTQKGDFSPEGELSFVPAPANRLDRNTSGLVVFGKTAEALKEVNRLFREDQVSKTYLTLVFGSLDDEVIIDDDISKLAGQNRVTLKGEKLEEDEKVWKKAALTSASPIIANDNYSLLKVNLHTGRTHQIRVHLASIGHPIVGDPKYGDLKKNKSLPASMAKTGQMLHAYSLDLGGKTFQAPLPKIWKLAIEECFGDKGRRLITRLRSVL